VSGNFATPVVSNSVTYDVTAPVFSSVSPVTATTVNNANVGYTLSETILSGTVTFTHTSGGVDELSPHVVNLTGAELNSGVFNGNLNNAPTLLDNAVYSISFDGVDEAGNIANTVLESDILYEFIDSLAIDRVVIESLADTVHPWDSVSLRVKYFNELGDEIENNVLSPVWTVGGVLERQIGIYTVLDTGSLWAKVSISGKTDSISSYSAPWVLPVLTTDSIIILPHGKGKIKGPFSEKGTVTIQPHDSIVSGITGEGVYIEATMPLDSISLTGNGNVYGGASGFDYLAQQSEYWKVVGSPIYTWIGNDNVTPKFEIVSPMDSMYKNTSFAIGYNLDDNLSNTTATFEWLEVGSSTINRTDKINTSSLNNEFSLDSVNLPQFGFVWRIVYSDGSFKDTTAWQSPAILSAKESMKEVLLKDSYNLLSFPFVTESSNILTLLEKSLGAYGKDSWRAFVMRDSIFIEIDELEGLDHFSIGESFWLYQRNQKDLVLCENVVFPGVDSTKWVLAPGWNAVSIPFASSIPFSWIENSNNLDSIGGPYFWKGDVQSWMGPVNLDSLHPWQGYLVKNKSLDTIVMNVPAFSTSKKSTARIINRDQSLVSFNLVGMGEEDHFITVGNGSVAKSNVKPPNPNNGIQLTVESNLLEKIVTEDDFSMQLLAKKLLANKRYQLQIDKKILALGKELMIIDEKNNTWHASDFDFVAGQEEVRSFRVVVNNGESNQAIIEGLQDKLPSKINSSWSVLDESFAVNVFIPIEKRDIDINIKSITADGKIINKLVSEKIDGGVYRYNFSYDQLKSNAGVYWIHIDIDNVWKDSYFFSR
jgi:hypothetical protein